MVGEVGIARYMSFLTALCRAFLRLKKGGSGCSTRRKRDAIQMAFGPSKGAFIH